MSGGHIDVVFFNGICWQRVTCGFLISFHRYLDLRGISNGVGPVIWPSSYGPAERDEAYKTFSLSGWAGRSGHDAPMIALDALLGAGSDWEELMGRAGFHGGQRGQTQKCLCSCQGSLTLTKCLIMNIFGACFSIKHLYS